MNPLTLLLLLAAQDLASVVHLARSWRHELLINATVGGPAATWGILVLMAHGGIYALSQSSPER